jgi:hypothetical protein
MIQENDQALNAARAGEDHSPARQHENPMVVRVLLVIGCLVGGCTPESSRPGVAGSNVTGNHPPVIRQASVHPNPVQLDGPIFVQIQADDPDRDPLTFHHQWTVNGQVLAGQTASTLPPTVLRRGDLVSVELVPDDGKARGAAFRTTTATVINTPPIVSTVTVHPQPALPGDKLDARVEVTDPDGDHIDLSFRWWQNGAVVKEGDDPVLDTTGFSPKDHVAVEVVPRDRTAAGKAVKSGPLLAGNSPPAIVSTPSAPTGREGYEYAVKAVDPEGDRLTYRLETAPSGMTIDAETGQIRWLVAPGLTGAHHVRVVVEDIGGGMAFQEFEVIVPSPAPTKSEGA